MNRVPTALIAGDCTWSSRRTPNRSSQNRTSGRRGSRCPVLLCCAGSKRMKFAGRERLACDNAWPRVCVIACLHAIRGRADTRGGPRPDPARKDISPEYEDRLGGHPSPGARNHPGDCREPGHGFVQSRDCGQSRGRARRSNLPEFGWLDTRGDAAQAFIPHGPRLGGSFSWRRDDRHCLSPAARRSGRHRCQRRPSPTSSSTS